jgi:hypothetical protein
MLSVAGSMLPPSSDLSDSATQAIPLTTQHHPPAFLPPTAIPALAPVILPPAPPITIKDKPPDMGIKPITDKDSWTEAKKIINARLQSAPYWPGESKEIITTDANAAASVWWEEVIAYYCRPPVLDLFVEEHCFDGKVFKMNACIDQHFNPSAAVDSLAYFLTSLTSSNWTKNPLSHSRHSSLVFSPHSKGGVSASTQPFKLDLCSVLCSPNIRRWSRSLSWAPRAHGSKSTNRH